MKITVLGCGALGQLWLASLYKQGHEVQGWLRVPQPFCHVNVVETDGSVFNQTLIANDPDFLANSDLLLVTLKAWQVSGAVKVLVGRLPANSPIVRPHTVVEQHTSTHFTGRHHTRGSPRRERDYSRCQWHNAYWARK